LEPDDLLAGMRSGVPQDADTIRAFVDAVVSGAMSRPQIAAWLAWAWSRGLAWEETLALTDAMTRSGECLEWPDGGLLADKHSTGGVGDKVSLILAPLWAELGWRVPMISGRGLGHTGGTLDKLESIAGYRTDLSVPELRGVLERVGCFISGQTADIAPADRILYALRDETHTVNSVPLIVASILSKKIAAGVQRLVLDVKVGSGAFMKTPEQAAKLAESLVQVARGAGLDCSAHVTAMDRPVGEAIGNALEVQESVACLKGEGPEDLRSLVLGLTDHPDAREVLRSGRAFDRFVQMVEAQGGDARALDAMGEGLPPRLVRAPSAGVVMKTCAYGLGRAAFLLGAGRRHAGDRIHPDVGLRLLVKPGDSVESGQPICEVYCLDDAAFESTQRMVEEACPVGSSDVSWLPLFGESW